MRNYVALAALLLVGCERPAIDANRAPPETTRDAPPTGEALEARVAAALTRARTRLEQELPPPADRERLRCPDEAIAAPSAESNALAVRTRDGRAERRSPLPLKLLTSLESDEFSPVVRHLTGGAAALWDLGQAKPRSPEAAREALRELELLAQRPYLAELFVEHYSEPRLFRRKDKPRSEWAAGALVGRVIVYDLEQRRALCQAPVVVHGDADGAPIRKRLREVTRERLRNALHDRTWSAMEAALGSISSRLVLPHPAKRNEAGQRWAAAEQAREPAPRRPGPGS